MQRSIINGAKRTEWTQVICPAQVTEKFALELKMKLLDAGFDHGSETKTLDGKTKEALRKFQLENKLPYGMIDEKTLTALGLEKYN